MNNDNDLKFAQHDQIAGLASQLLSNIKKGSREKGEESTRSGRDRGEVDREEWGLFDRER